MGPWYSGGNTSQFWKIWHYLPSLGDGSDLEQPDIRSHQCMFLISPLNNLNDVNRLYCIGSHACKISWTSHCQIEWWILFSLFFCIIVALQCILFCVLGVCGIEWGTSIALLNHFSYSVCLCLCCCASCHSPHWFYWPCHLFLQFFTC